MLATEPLISTDCPLPESVSSEVDFDQSGGHVFVLHGCLGKISCDAWMVPTDTNLRTDGWDLEPIPSLVKPSNWGLGMDNVEIESEQRVMKYAIDGCNQNTPWLVLCSLTEQEQLEYHPSVELEWYIKGVRLFLEHVSKDLEDCALRLNCGRYSPAHGRSKPLVLVPVVGTGDGGGKSRTGEVIKKLLLELWSCSKRLQLDIGVVTRQPSKFAALQTERMRIFQTRGASDIVEPWSCLPSSLKTKGDELANMASRGALALFLGAGVSSSAGLPNWKQLLKMLADDAGICDDEQDKLLNDFDLMDAASIIEKRLSLSLKGSGFKEQVATMLTRELYTPMHSLLASLPVKEVITTNYDDMAERAGEAVENPYAVLPSEAFVGTKNRWVLKLHGCVKQPSTIVLSRQDYMRYNDTRAALAGIVHALLLTRHMVFIGFSLRDENFHRILDTVRKARQPSLDSLSKDTKKMGTQIILYASSLHSELWKDDLQTICISDVFPDVDEASKSGKTSEYARLVEIFMDWIVAKSRPLTSYLLVPECEGILSEPELKIRKAMKDFIQTAPKSLFQLSVFHDILHTFERLGDKELRARSDSCAVCDLEDSSKTTETAFVFIIQGEICNLQCDAAFHGNWYKLSDATIRWRKSDSAEEVVEALTDHIPLKRLAESDVISTKGDDDSYSNMENMLKTFLGLVTTSFKEKKRQANPKLMRSKPLIAIPLNRKDDGHISTHFGHIKSFVESAQRLACEYDVDIALATDCHLAFAAAQSARRRLDTPVDLRPELQEEVKRLVGLARSGKLAVFIGPGLCRLGGGISWKSALLTAARDIGYFLPDELEQMHSFSHDYIERLLLSRISKEDLSNRVSKLIDDGMYGLAHSLLASLPVQQFISTSVDLKLPQAANGFGEHKIEILSAGRVFDSRRQRWVLMMNGFGADVIRDDADDARCAAYMGVVQATLFTRHVLFLGIRLQTDSKTLAVLDSVNRFSKSSLDSEQKSATAKTPMKPMQPPGTLIRRSCNRMEEGLWRGMHVVNLELNACTGDAQTTAVEVADRKANRRLELFLDCMVARSRGLGAHLLSDDWKSMLSPDEVLARDSLIALIKGVEGAGADRDSPVMHRLRKLFCRIGYSSKGPQGAT